MGEKLFTWSDRYLIGVEELDFEHQNLLESLNTLHLDILRGDAPEIIEACVGEICTRVAAHFALEEQYMRRTKFVNYEEHKKEHDRFLDEIYDVVEMFNEDLDTDFQEALETRLEGWITNHILTSDKQLALKS